MGREAKDCRKRRVKSSLVVGPRLKVEDQQGEGKVRRELKEKYDTIMRFKNQITSVKRRGRTYRFFLVDFETTL